MSDIDNVSAGQTPEGDRPHDPAQAAEAPFTQSQQDWLRSAIIEGFHTAHQLGAQNPTAPSLGGAGPPLRTGTPINPNRPDTPYNDFIHGVKGKLKFTMNGVATPTDYPIEMFSMDDVVETDDVTNSSSSGWKIKLDGLREITGNLTFVFDSLNIPGATAVGATGTIGINPWRPRIYCTLYLLPDGLTQLIIPALISSLSYSSGPKAGTTRCTCKYELSGVPTIPNTSQLVPTPMLT